MTRAIRYRATAKLFGIVARHARTHLFCAGDAPEFIRVLGKAKS
jgi:hypothetical protein